MDRNSLFFDRTMKIGTKVRTTCTIYADPEKSGLMTFQSEKFVKMPPGSIGVVEDNDVDTQTGATFAVVRFSSGLIGRVRQLTLQSVSD